MIWIGTYKGLAVLNPQTDNFINYKKQNNLLPGMSFTVYWKVVMERSGLVLPKDWSA